MTEEEAIAYVKSKAHTAEFPVVPDEEVTSIVRMNKRADVWEASTEYAAGAKVQPTVPNGHFYVCRQAGNSGAIEPDWNTRETSRTYDGDSVIWQEFETDTDGNLFILRNAIHECWLYKAGASATQFDVSIDQQNWKRSQIHDHCMEMAKSFSPIE